MSYVRILVLLLAALCGGAATAQEAARVEAEKLLETMNMKVAFDQAVAISLDTQLKAKPELVPYKDVMLAFFAKYTSYEALKPAMIEIYVAEFTAAELKELREFYSTPTGRKAVDRIPAIMVKGAEMGRKAVQDNMAELKQMLEAETKRIEEKADAEAKAADDAANVAAKEVAEDDGKD